MWNLLPVEVRNSRNIDIFKGHSKKVMLNNIR